MDAGYILTLRLENPKAILRKTKKLKMWRATLEAVNRTIEVWKQSKFFRVVEVTVDRPGEGRIRG